MDSKSSQKLIEVPRRIFYALYRRCLRLRSREPEAKRLGGWVYGKLKGEHLSDVFPDIQNERIEIHKAYNRTFDTSLDLLELCALCAIVRHIKAKRIIEIGTFNGNTTLNIAANVAEGGSVVTVDLPPLTDFSIKVPEVMDNRSNPSNVGIQYKGTPYEKIIQQVFADSAKLNYESLSPLFDLFFIDGCHSAQYVKHDTEMAFKYTRKGGIIVWHDYGMIRDVSKIVDEFTDKIDIHAIRGCRLAVGLL